MSPLPRAAARAAAALEAAGIAAEIVEMPDSTRTAEDAAAACGCPLGAIVKSLVFRAETGEGVLVLTSGANRVDPEALGPRLGTVLGRADAAFVRETTGFAIGGVPPLGHASVMRVVMDPDLMAFETVWAAAGTPRTVFPVAPGRLADATAAALQPVA